MMGEDETGTLTRLQRLRQEFLYPKVTEYGGRIVKTTGDGTLIEFPSAVDAVQHAVDVQTAIGSWHTDTPDHQRIELRMGINVGDVIIEGDDIYGDGVNVAARLEVISDPGGICISGTAFDQVKGKLDLPFDDLGLKEVKNIAEPVRVYRWPIGQPNEIAKAPPEQKTTSPDKPSIAVLPFNNMSNDPEQEYFADGISEDLITDLSKLEGMTVIARNSSFAFKGQQVDVKEAAHTLGVRNVLEGSVRKMGDRVRINAQLIDGVTGAHIWADRYDGSFEDIFDLQDEIMEKIVAALEVNLTRRDREQTRHRSTDNVEAYDLFLQGRTKVYSMMPKAMAEARALFQRAIELDDKFVAPYAMISCIAFLGWLFRWPGHKGELADAVSIAQQAIDIDAQSGIAHTWLGWAQLFTGDHDLAISNLERGVELDPTYAEGYAYLAEALNYAGDPERAVEMIRKALKNDPLLPPNCQFHLGHSYYLMGRYEEAAEAISSALKIVPELPVGHIILAAVYVELGRLEDAAKEVETLLNLAPEHSVELISRQYPHRPPEVKARLLESLGKAGLPQN
jgi:TolB-like protein/Flp pilus assembly protein TadD